MKLKQTHKLRPRARLLRTLGEELISSDTVAIIELVKNAYDADATRVVVRLEGVWTKNAGVIDVIDNGNGMKSEAMQTVFLEPATPSKRGSARTTARFGRRYLGEKGIGRFASARLAHRLEMISRADGELLEAIGEFDWDQFENEALYLDEVEVRCDEGPATAFMPNGTAAKILEQASKTKVEVSHGTWMRMCSAKRPWSHPQIHELSIALSRLVLPDDSPNGFRIFLEIVDRPEWSRAIEAPDILERPHYTIKANVEADGRCSGTAEIHAEGRKVAFAGTLVRIGKDDDPTIDLVPTVTDAKHVKAVRCGKVSIELRAWDRNELGNIAEAIDSTLKNVREDLDNYAGISIYRDGFRVLPYGERNDDWARLDMRRVQNPTLRLSQNQVYGAIRITADGNPGLRDMSNRIGMENTPEMADLRGVVHAVLAELETPRYELRVRRDSKKRPAGGLFSGFGLESVAAGLKAKYPEDKELAALVEKTDKDQVERLKDIQIVVARYQRLATLGTLIDHLLHEGVKPLQEIRGEAYDGKRDIETADDPRSEPLPLLAKRFDAIDTFGEKLHLAFQRVAPFGGRRRGKPEANYIERIISEAFALYETDLKRLHVTFQLPKSETMVRLDKIEIGQVIINLLQNSLYWLEHVPPTNRNILVSVSRPAPETLEVVFADSGPGIPSTNRSLIFEPYFTTKPDGVGLGLAIVGEIVQDFYDGTIELMDPGPLPGACFKITLRKRA